MDQTPHICNKKRTMIKNIEKNQMDSEVNQRSLANFRKVQSQTMSKVNVKQKLLSIGILMFLGAWISLSLNLNGFLSIKILVCSFIIICLLFIRIAGAVDDLNNKDLTK
ncbi:MAG: hypothetical protein ACJAT4_001601 [Granulosicoccus sp.]|jgi:hypothetical protein